MSVDVKYTTTATATGGRDGRAATKDGAFEVKLARPKELGGRGDGNNPEQLFAAGYAACCGAIERMDLRGELGRIRAPTLVVSGADDLATPLEHQRLIAESIPGARHEIVSPAGHVAVVEQPQAVNRLIEEHLA